MKSHSSIATETPEDTMSRKTIKIASIVDKCNEFLLNTADEMQLERDALMMFVFNVLHETGNYKGFRYLCAKDMAESDNGKSVGIVYLENGDPDFTDSDNTRIKIL
jgi:hypothetical protein